MPSRLVLLAAVVLGSPPAAAEPTTPRPGPPPKRVAFYTDASIGFAVLTGGYTDWEGGFRRDSANNAFLRWSLGAQLRHHRMRAKLGGVLEVEASRFVYTMLPRLGVELSVDWELGRWRLGPRVAIAGFDGNVTPLAYGGTTGTAGLRLHRSPWTLGVDAVHVWNDYGYANGMMASIGVGDRPGKYALGASAIGGAVIGLLVLASFPRT